MHVFTHINKPDINVITGRSYIMRMIHFWPFWFSGWLLFLKDDLAQHPKVQSLGGKRVGRQKSGRQKCWEAIVLGGKSVGRQRSGRQKCWEAIVWGGKRVGGKCAGRQ